MRLSDVLSGMGVPDASSTVGARCVNRTLDFVRVDELPRRDAWASAASVARALTLALRAPAGTMTLRPAQAMALCELPHARGLLGAMGVGQGKTLVTQLAPTVLRVARCVVMLPVGLVGQWRRELEHNAKHWRIDPAAFTLVPYSTLSTAKGANALESAEPELIVCDEVHNLRHATAARTKRVARYLAAHPQTMMVALSGTITARSLWDYAHIARWALGESAPVPLERRAIDAWAGALDEGLKPDEVYQPGALLGWCEPGEAPREGFRRRLTESPGVIATLDSALGTGLEIGTEARPCPIIEGALSDLGAGRGRFANVSDPLDRANYARQLVCGFFYRWQWPNGVADEGWLTARGAWRTAVAEWLDGPGAVEGFDSPALLAGACGRGKAPSGALARAWQGWAPHRAKPTPPSLATHLSGVPGEWAAEWLARDKAPGIVWVEHSAAGRAIAERCGLGWFGEGSDPGALTASVSIVASIKAHGTGRNLQRWPRNLILSVPSRGSVWEQLLGRTHRPGQLADTVTATVAGSYPNQRRALAQARRDAAYIEATTGQPQKLTIATYLNETDLTDDAN